MITLARHTTLRPTGCQYRPGTHSIVKHSGLTGKGLEQSFGFLDSKSLRQTWLPAPTPPQAAHQATDSSAAHPILTDSRATTCPHYTCPWNPGSRTTTRLGLYSSLESISMPNMGSTRTHSACTHPFRPRMGGGPR